MVLLICVQDSHQSDLEVEPLDTENKRTVEIVLDESADIPRNNEDIPGTELYKCTFCEFSTAELPVFQSHKAECNIQFPFKCTICEKKFESHKYVRNHIMEEHLSNWTCHFCNKNFREEKDFTSHIKVHLGHNSTISKIQVEDTISVSSGEDDMCNSPHIILGNFECNICDYQCNNKKIFDDHVRKHVVLKLFQCKICKERFQHKHDLAQHIQEHKTQIFKCNMCPSEFDKRDNYLQHVRMHEVVTSRTDTLERLVNENNITLETVLNEASEGDCFNSLISKSEDKSSNKSNEIQFHTCQICSLTFVNMSRFLDHTKMHRQNEEVFSEDADQLLQVEKVNLDEDSNEHDVHSIDSEGRQPYVDMDESLEDMFEKLHAETERNGNANPDDKRYVTSTLSMLRCSTCQEQFMNDDDLQLHRMTQMHLENVSTSGSDKVSMLIEEKPNILQDKFDDDCKVEQNTISFNTSENIDPSVTDNGLCMESSIVAQVEQNITNDLKDIVLETDTLSAQENQNVKDSFIDIFDMVREKKMSCNDDAEIDHNFLQTMCEQDVKNEDNTLPPMEMLCQSSDLTQNDLNTSVLTAGETKKTYVCAMCGFRTPTMLDLRVHFREHKFQCNVCKKVLPTSQKLAFHMKTHEKFRGKMTCPYCYQELPNKYKLQQHLQDKHQKDKIMYKCCFCNETFNTKKAYKAHEEVHPERFSFKCDECDQTFMKEKQLLDHKDALHRDPRCRFCGKEILKAKTLRNHELRHIREKDSFECDICKRVFKTKTGLRHHVAVHTGEYKYCCDYCGRGFMSRMMMEEHLSMHTKEERYICDVCGRKFSFQSTYWIHRKWHDNPYPYKCNFCSRKFRHSSLLAVHKRKHTGERPYKCPHCPLTFPVGGTLKRHLILHTGVYPFNCESCRRGFTTRHKYATHLAKIHGDYELLHAKPQQGEFKMVIRDDPKPAQKSTIWKVAEHSPSEQMMKLESIAGDDETSKDAVENGITCAIVSDNMLIDSVVPTRVVEIVLDETSQAVATVTLAEHANMLPDIWYQ